MNAAEAASKLADRCKSLCEHLLPNGVVERNEFVVGNVCGEAGRSLAVHLVGAKGGVWCDFNSGERGDALDLVRAVKRLDTPAAIAWAATWLGEPEDEAKKSVVLLKDGVPLSVTSATNVAVEKRDSGGSNGNTERAKAVWRACRPANVIAETYFASRGLELAIPPTIRETPSLKHRPTGLSLPAIVCAVQRPDGKIAGIHRTYLSLDFRKKAGVDQARMMLGPLSGNTVRLAPAAEKMALAEGLENGLSVLQSCPDLPVWCCLSVSNLAPLLPDQVTEIILCLDGDDPGSKAFQVSERRVQDLIGRGLNVRKFRAPSGMDHNDLLQLPANVVPLKIKETAHG